MTVVNVNNQQHININIITDLPLEIIYSVRVPRPLVIVSTADISVLHSAEVVHFHCES